MTWHERIDRAEKCGNFIQTDRLLAFEWDTCACNEQDPRIPRFFEGAPRDMRLITLGIKFAFLIEENNIPEARTTLAAIGKRAGEILEGMG